jgi:DNA-binding transcriptional LysR family regulator
LKNRFFLVPIVVIIVPTPERLSCASYENVRSAVSAGLGIGVLPSGAVAEDHFVLTAKDGFPSLQAVHLILMYRSQGVVFDQLADMLRALVTRKSDKGRL